LQGSTGIESPLATFLSNKLLVLLVSIKIVIG